MLDGRSARESVAGVLMMAVLVSQWLSPAFDPASEVDSEKAFAGLSGPDVAEDRRSAPVDDGDALARPLFQPDRQMPERIRSGHETIHYRLAGILLTQSDRVGIFAPQNGGKQVAVRVGEGVGNLKLTTIEKDYIQLSNGIVMHTQFASLTDAEHPDRSQTGQDIPQSNEQRQSVASVEMVPELEMFHQLLKPGRSR